MKFKNLPHYLEFLTGGLELRFFSKSMVVDLITKNDLMYFNDFIGKAFYKKTEKILVDILIVNK
jgi:hypothetical protein